MAPISVGRSGANLPDGRSSRFAWDQAKQTLATRHRMGAQACIEAEQAPRLMHGNGKQVGVGDLAVSPQARQVGARLSAPDR